jgi:hypothetical protein
VRNWLSKLSNRNPQIDFSHFQIKVSTHKKGKNTKGFDGNARKTFWTAIEDVRDDIFSNFVEPIIKRIQKRSEDINKNKGW